MLYMSELREYGEYLRDREMSENTVGKYLRDAENFGSMSIVGVGFLRIPLHS